MPDEETEEPETEEPETEDPSIWELLDDKTPTGCSNIASLYSWSLNYDAGKGPFLLFLDMIGYTQDEFGEAMYNLSEANLGYRELHELRDAISDYLEEPHRVMDFVTALMEAEARG